MTYRNDLDLDDQKRLNQMAWGLPIVAALLFVSAVVFFTSGTKHTTTASNTTPVIAQPSSPAPLAPAIPTRTP